MFIIQFRYLVFEGLGESEGKTLPIWTATVQDAKRFTTREEAETVVDQYQGGSAMLGAEVVPLEPYA